MRLKDKKISLLEHRIIGRNELNQPIYGCQRTEAKIFGPMLGS